MATRRVRRPRKTRAPKARRPRARRPRTPRLGLARKLTNALLTGTPSEQPVSETLASMLGAETTTRRRRRRKTS